MFFQTRSNSSTVVAHRRLKDFDSPSLSPVIDLGILVASFCHASTFQLFASINSKFRSWIVSEILLNIRSYSKVCTAWALSIPFFPQQPNSRMLWGLCAICIPVCSGRAGAVPGRNPFPGTGSPWLSFSILLLLQLLRDKFCGSGEPVPGTGSGSVPRFGRNWLWEPGSGNPRY